MPEVVDLRAGVGIDDLPDGDAGLGFLVARLADEPVACGFVERSTESFAEGDVAVVTRVTTASLP
jgi:hypothetical protein